MKGKLLLLFSVVTISSYAQGLYFPPNTGTTWETLSPQSLNWCPDKLDLLNDFLENNNSKAFILLKDGKIVIESYFDNHTVTSSWYWASAGKTITGFMTGIAQQEGFLSINSPTTTYLGQGWTSCTTTEEQNITIRNQLNMTSGLDDGVPDPSCTNPSCLECLAPAGTRWSYHNAPYTLLDQVIESATGVTLNNYTTQKLKTPTGMTGIFIPSGNNNVFFSNARSMARFGLLMLNNGNWNGNQIMTDTNYFNQMITTSQPLNEAYGYLWWLNGTSTFMVPGFQTVFNGQLFPDAPIDTYVALGRDGQFLNVVPSSNLVWIRMGENPDNLPVPLYMNNLIWEYINDLECEMSTQDLSKNSIRITPNPVDDSFTLKAENELSKTELFNAQSQLLQTYQTSGLEVNINVASFAPGIYLVKVHFVDGKSVVRKFVKK